MRSCDDRCQAEKEGDTRKKIDKSVVSPRHSDGGNTNAKPNRKSLPGLEKSFCHYPTLKGS